MPLVGVGNGECWFMAMGFLFGVIKCSGDRLWGWLYTCINVLITIKLYISKKEFYSLWIISQWSCYKNWNFGWLLFQVTQAVAKLGMSQIPQKDLLETVRVREQAITKKSKQELPPPPPPKKRQIHVDIEAKKKWEEIEKLFKSNIAHTIFSTWCLFCTNH